MLTLDPAGTLFYSLRPTACPMKQRNVGLAFLSDEQKLEQNPTKNDTNKLPFNPVTK